MPADRRLKIDAPFASDAEVLALVAAFEACALPYERWTHRAHLAVALVALGDGPYDEAVVRVCAAIPRYNRARGDPLGYHETVTLLFLRRVAAWRREHPATPLAEAVEALARECDMAWPLRYYSPERLWSAEARAGWVEPDLRPLDF